MKRNFTLLVFCMASFFMYAQDVIITNNAEKIDAKILEVSKSEVRYKESSNLDGPTIVLSSDEISSIIYSNNKVVVYNNNVSPKIETNSKSKKKASTAFIGLTGTCGIDLGRDLRYLDYYNSEYSVGLDFKFGVDFAWYVSKKFAIGGYATVGVDFGIRSATSIWHESSKYAVTHYDTFNDFYFCPIDIRLGLLMLFGSRDDNPYILGISPCTGYVGGGSYMTFTPIEVRFGKVINKDMYFTFNLASGLPGIFIEPSLSMGFKLKEKK